MYTHISLYTILMGPGSALTVLNSVSLVRLHGLRPRCYALVALLGREDDGSRENLFYCRHELGCLVSFSDTTTHSAPSLFSFTFFLHVFLLQKLRHHGLLQDGIPP